MGREASWLGEHIVDVADFPRPGVVFKDITPLLATPDAFRFSVDAMADHFTDRPVDKVVGVESRGFILAAPVAYRLGAAFVPARKAGKLPGETAGQAYCLEYGEEVLEIRSDSVVPGDAVLVVDDVLATGGTAVAATTLVERLGGSVVGLAFLLELGFLEGRKLLRDREVLSLVEAE